MNLRKLLFTAAGAAGAYFLVRALAHRMDEKNHERLLAERHQRRTGRQEFAAGEGEGAAVRSHPTRGAGDWRNAEMPSGAVGGEPFLGRRTQPEDQPDAAPELYGIPQTGGAAIGTPGLSMEDLVREVVEARETEVTYSGADDTTALADTLTEYLFSFRGMIDQIRLRRREGAAGERSLTPADRQGVEESLRRLEDRIPDYGEGNLEDGSLQERMYRLMAKTREALENTGYSDDDLFRINGEVRTEACRLLADLRAQGLPAGARADDVLALYECGE
jgi:hypothetical protein